MTESGVHIRKKPRAITDGLIVIGGVVLANEQAFTRTAPVSRILPTPHHHANYHRTWRSEF